MAEPIAFEITPDASDVMRRMGAHRKLWPRVSRNGQMKRERAIDVQEAAAVVDTIDQACAGERLTMGEKQSLKHLRQAIAEQLERAAVALYRPLSELYEPAPETQNPLLANFLSGDRWGHFETRGFFREDGAGLPRGALPSATCQWDFVRQHAYLLDVDDRISTLERAHRLGHFHGLMFGLPVGRNNPEWVAVLTAVRMGESATVRRIEECRAALAAKLDGVQHSE